MTRKQRAIEYAKAEIVRQNPWMADRQARIDFWKTALPLEKRMFLEIMTDIANSDLERVEEVEVLS